MSLSPIKIGNVTISRMIIGGNPFSGFSHQGVPRDKEMVHYHTTARIKETLRLAEKLGINSHISRGDHHVLRYLTEYWDEGGKMQWICQTCPEVGNLNRVIDNGLSYGAKAIFFHGGMMDYRVKSNTQLDELPAAVERIRKAGVAAGVAGHVPATHQWAEKNLDVDFYMCSYYNPIIRAAGGEHIHGYEEEYRDADRDTMVQTIRTLKRPVIHYKVLAAGRNKPQDALPFVVKHLRPQDAVCVGYCLKDNANAIQENLSILERALAATSHAKPVAVAARG